jgi:hypothetical protein
VICSGCRRPQLLQSGYAPLCLRLRCLLAQGQAKMKGSLCSQACCRLNEDLGLDLFDSLDEVRGVVATPSCYSGWRWQSDTLCDDTHSSFSFGFHLNWHSSYLQSLAVYFWHFGYLDCWRMWAYPGLLSSFRIMKWQIRWNAMWWGCHYIAMKSTLWRKFNPACRHVKSCSRAWNL